MKQLRKRLDGQPMTAGDLAAVLQGLRGLQEDCPVLLQQVDAGQELALAAVAYDPGRPEDGLSLVAWQEQCA